MRAVNDLANTLTAGAPVSGAPITRISDVNTKRGAAKHSKAFAALCLWLLMLPPCYAATDTRFIELIPDLTQTDIRGRSFGDGSQFCGPVAVSNSLAWLADKRGAQIEMAITLASKAYMDTSLVNGTGTMGMLKGIKRMSNELFGGYKTLLYQGWRIHQSEFATGVRTPQLSWLTEHITPRSAVWLNVGWYARQNEGKDLRRVGGHWLTLVGYQGGDTLILHDPAPRAGRAFANEYVKVETLHEGRLTGKNKGLPQQAKGFLSLTEGMHIKAGAQLAVVDGAIVLVLR